MKISLKKVAKNPAYSLSAMIYGLQNPIETEDVKYQVDMDVFSAARGDGTMCYGCAATSTLEVVTGRSLAEYVSTLDVVGDLPDIGYSFGRVTVFNTDEHEMMSFEASINNARQGNFQSLMIFFGYKNGGKYNRLIYMCTKTWKEKVPHFEKVINEMHEDYPDWERFTAPGEQDD